MKAGLNFCSEFVAKIQDPSAMKRKVAFDRVNSLIKPPGI